MSANKLASKSKSGAWVKVGVVLLVLCAGLGVCLWAAEPGAGGAEPVPQPSKPPAPLVESPDVHAVVAGNNEFALDLYAKLRGSKGNLFFSPYSISAALAMTHAGARGNTEKQMAETLHFTLPQDRLHPAFALIHRELNPDKKQDYELITANALWGQKGYEFLKEFLDQGERYYGAGLHELDFQGAPEAARKTVNDWVEEKTKKKIKNLIPPGAFNAMTRLVLTNAIYFKGDWDSPFHKALTKDEPFMPIGEKEITVPMMNKRQRLNYIEEGEFQGIEIPYAGRELSMIILLPKEPAGLPAFEKSLTLKKLSEWMSHLKKQRALVALTLPRFDLGSQFDLAGVLKSMGMSDAFSLPPADFSGMTPQKELFIQSVIHKAIVEVNEEGTVAAAATGVMIAATAEPAKPPKPIVFRADHPFLFLIRHAPTNSILFMGRVMNPKTSVDSRINNAHHEGHEAHEERP